MGRSHQARRLATQEGIATSLSDSGAGPHLTPHHTEAMAINDTQMTESDPPLDWRMVYLDWPLHQQLRTRRAVQAKPHQGAATLLTDRAQEVVAEQDPW